jgi:hypothetical protein
MALTTRRKKQGAVVAAAVGALTLAGVAVSTLSSSGSPAGSSAVAAAAVPQGTQNAAPNAAPSETSSSSAAGTLTVTATADNSKPTDETVFTVSGEVKGAQPGTKIRLQRQAAPTSANAAPGWSTLAYTTFTDKGSKFSFPVKIENAGSFNLRVLHPQDKEGPETVYSSPFAVTVSGTASSGASSKASSAASKASSKVSSAVSSASSAISSKKG